MATRLCSCLFLSYSVVKNEKINLLFWYKLTRNEMDLLIIKNRASFMRHLSSFAVFIDDSLRILHPIHLVYGRGLIKILIDASLSQLFRRIPRTSPLVAVRYLPYKFKLLGLCSTLDGKGSVSRIVLGQYP